MEERLPQDESIVDKIATGLSMSEEERKQLHIAYQRGKLGKSLYGAYCLLLSMRERKEESEPVFVNFEQLKEQAAELIPAESIYLSGYEAIGSWVYYLCDSVSEICVEVSLDCKEVLEIIIEQLRRNPACAVKFQISVSSILKENELETMQIFKTLFSCMELENPCKIYHRYHNQKNGDTNELKNYYISSSRGMLMISWNEGEEEPVGVYSSRPQMLQYYEKTFRNRLLASQLYAEVVTGHGMKNYDFNENGMEQRGETYIFQNEQTGTRITIYEQTLQTWIKVERPGIWKHQVVIAENNIVELMRNYLMHEEQIRKIV